MTSGTRLAPWSLDWTVSAMLAASSGARGHACDRGLDERTRRALEARRTRALVRRARDTPYYRRVLDDACATTQDTFDALPVTSKSALRADPDAFLPSSAAAALQTGTTGTTGQPTGVCFSRHELRILAALAALSYLARGDIGPEDIVHLCSSPRAIGTTILATACAQLGAVACLTGPVDPAVTLAELQRSRTIAGHRARASVLACYPSYLGELIEAASRQGVRSRDLGLRRVVTGGEILTQGLRRRARAVLGDLAFVETYALTETLPLGGVPCSQGHLHFEPSHGLVEVLALDGRRLARPGELGTLLLTPFPPFRETTLLVRYDTEDLVQQLELPLTCGLRHRLPATGHIEGKRSQAIRSEAGDARPRQILEALEEDDAVPVPARYAARPANGGVSIDVVTRDASRGTWCRLHEALVVAGVPVRKLRLRLHPGELAGAFPRRSDLREPTHVEGKP